MSSTTDQREGALVQLRQACRKLRAHEPRCSASESKAPSRGAAPPSKAAATSTEQLVNASCQRKAVMRSSKPPFALASSLSAPSMSPYFRRSPSQRRKTASLQGNALNLGRKTEKVAVKGGAPGRSHDDSPLCSPGACASERRLFATSKGSVRYFQPSSTAKSRPAVQYRDASFSPVHIKRPSLKAPGMLSRALLQLDTISTGKCSRASHDGSIFGRLRPRSRTLGNIHQMGTGGSIRSAADGPYQTSAHANSRRSSRIILSVGVLLVSFVVLSAFFAGGEFKGILQEVKKLGIDSRRKLPGIVENQTTDDATAPPTSVKPLKRHHPGGQGVANTEFPEATVFTQSVAYSPVNDTET